MFVFSFGLSSVIFAVKWRLDGGCFLFASAGSLLNELIAQHEYLVCQQPFPYGIRLSFDNPACQCI